MCAATTKQSTWAPHWVRAGTYSWSDDAPPDDPKSHKDHVEPWLSALFQAEHLNLLVGSGFTTAIAHEAGASIVDMSPVDFSIDYADAVQKAAEESSESLGRKTPNIEDQIRSVRELIGGLRILVRSGDPGVGLSGIRLVASLASWERELDQVLLAFVGKILDAERGVEAALTGVKDQKLANRVRRLIGGFLLPFASRAATRERPHIFTTNYDRLVEYGCDLLGLRLVDRFVGNLAPVFRSSRLGVDLHYNPPGIRGEPRYLEGVVRLTKLHGSVDWRYEDGPSGNPEVQRCGLPFGAPKDHPAVPKNPIERLLIYPNPAKDVETLEYPYAELFRDFAAACCQPNAVVVTYGYGFGDDHVNRVIRDMLGIPSTHLVIISFDYADGRICRFCDQTARDEQITMLVGPHFGNLSTLVKHYLPKPAIDRTTWRMMELLNRRAHPKTRHTSEDDANTASGEDEP